ncbi:MAG: hypothetical protein Tsb009_25510 [Planctomycetaceae bacterium]
MIQKFAQLGVLITTVIITGQLASAATPAELLKTIKAVQSEGKGNVAAQAAWRELVKSNVKTIPQILRAFDGASPLAVNWLQSAVETIASHAEKNGDSFPVAELKTFIKNRKQDPRARRLAFELLRQADSKAAEQLVPGLLLDPSADLRREAVQRLIREAKKLAEQDKNAAIKTYRKALQGAVDDDQVKAIVAPLKKLGETVDLQQHFGFLTNWKIIGPFDNKDKKGFNIAYPPEKKLDLNATYESNFQGKSMQVKWVPVATKDSYGIIDIAKSLKNYKGSVMYATTTFVSPKKQTVQFRLGTPNSWKLWVNGKLLFAREEYHRGMVLDQYRVPAELKPGKNVILIKILQNEQTQPWAQRYRFQIRVCDGAGSAIHPANQSTSQLNQTEKYVPVNSTRN